MGNLEQAVQTQLKNIQKKINRTLDELSMLAKNSGLSKHASIREMFMRELGLGYGDANALVHAVLQSDGTRAALASGLSGEALLDQLYSGPKAALQPVHSALMTIITGLGEFETLPKKGYVSLRRVRQFVMIGPATNMRVELGLNAHGLNPDPRLLEQPKGSMCNYIIRLSDPGQVDSTVAAWLKTAFDMAG